MRNLLPLPVLDAMSDPPDDTDALKAWLKQMADRQDDLHGIMHQNVARLSAPVAAKAGPSGPSVGLGMAVNELTGEFWNMATAAYKMGLVVAPGADTGKVNVTFKFLGVGPYVCGNGTAVTYTADLAVSGLGGLDTGSRAQAWYAVHVIAGAAGDEVRLGANVTHPPAKARPVRTNVLLSLSPTAPTLPPGYSYFRRVGWVKTGANPFPILAFMNRGDWWHWDAPLNASPYRVLNAGTSATFADVDCSGIIPTTSTLALLHLQSDNSTGGTAGTGFYVRPNGSARTNDAGSDWSVGGGIPNGGFIQWGEVIMPTDASQIIEYRINSAGFQAYIYVTGYYDPV